VELTDVQGTSLRGFFAREITGPLGLDCFIGVPEADLPRLATMVFPTLSSFRVRGLIEALYASPALNEEGR
jgi:hypothetical protein